MKINKFLFPFISAEVEHFFSLSGQELLQQKLLLLSASSIFSGGGNTNTERNRKVCYIISIFFMEQNIRRSDKQI